VKSCHTLKAVSDSIPLSTDIRTQGWVVVKLYKSEDGPWFDKDGGSDDSDCESGLDQSRRSATKTEVGSKESGRDASTVLSTGSFAG